MDINILRTLITIASLAAFLGIVWWAYAPSRKGRFERDALLPFAEQDDERAPGFRDGTPHPLPLSRVERGNGRRDSVVRPIPVDKEEGR